MAVKKLRATYHPPLVRSALIRHPQEIVVVDEADGIKSVAVKSKDGVEETIRFKDPLMLPASAGA